MPLPLLAMALGGAAMGALANKKDRKKGALMGLGAGLLGPAIGAMGAGGAATAATAAPLAAGAGTAAAGTAAAGTAAAGTAGAGAAGTAAAAAPAAAAGGMGAMTKSMIPAMLPLVMPKKGPAPPQAGGSYANNSQGQAGGQPNNMYAQAMINKQERMKGRTHRRSFK